MFLILVKRVPKILFYFSDPQAGHSRICRRCGFHIAVHCPQRASDMAWLFVVWMLVVFVMVVFTSKFIVMSSYYRGANGTWGRFLIFENRIIPRPPKGSRETSLYEVGLGVKEPMQGGNNCTWGFTNEFTKNSM